MKLVCRIRPYKTIFSGDLPLHRPIQVPEMVNQLVVSTHLKNNQVNWDDDIPNIWKNKIHVPVTTNQSMIQGKPCFLCPTQRLRLVSHLSLRKTYEFEQQVTVGPTDMGMENGMTGDIPDSGWFIYGLYMDNQWIINGLCIYIYGLWIIHG